MHSTILLSKLRISFVPTNIFCFLLGGPEVRGVDGTAESGVGGCGMVAEAGVRGTVLVVDSFRLTERGSGVVA